MRVTWLVALLAGCSAVPIEPLDPWGGWEWVRVVWTDEVDALATCFPIVAAAGAIDAEGLELEQPFAVTVHGGWCNTMGHALEISSLREHDGMLEIRVDLVHPELASQMVGLVEADAVVTEDGGWREFELQVRERYP